MTRKDVDTFEKTQAQLEGLYTEISTLAKKSPNDSVNKFKLAFINEVLKTSNTILGDTYKPLNKFELFNDDDIPSNSDVVFILSQYLSCFEKLRIDNISKYSGNWYWAIDGERSDIITGDPKKLK